MKRVLASIIMLGAMGFTPSNSSAVFTPLELQSGSIRFAVIGDYGKAGPPALAVSQLVKSWNVDFIITVGDNNYMCGDEDDLASNIGQYYGEFITADLSTNRFFPSLGNHDWGQVCPGGRNNRCRRRNVIPYTNYFTLTDSNPNPRVENERYYSFTKGDIQFFALDSDCNEPDGNVCNSIQGRWLKTQLSTSNAHWKVVYFHHPPYSSGYHGSSLYMRWPFREWGASVVLSGHEHDYEHAIVDDFHYFVNGLGGTDEKRDFCPTSIGGSQKRLLDGYGAMLVTVTSDRMNLKFITTDGTERETVDIDFNRNNIFTDAPCPRVQPTGETCPDRARARNRNIRHRRRGTSQPHNR